jgi:hypothetical protein
MKRNDRNHKHNFGIENFQKLATKLKTRYWSVNEALKLSTWEYMPNT